jgi:hypothetical protein
MQKQIKPKPKAKPKPNRKPLVKKKYIESPEMMWELFEQYQKKVKSNPFYVRDWVGGMAMQVERPKEKPLTYEGFSNYVFSLGIIKDTDDYFGNTGGAYGLYSDVCQRIKRTIREDQIAGGMAGVYNPSITQRLNNLVEKTQTDLKVEQPLFPD